MRHGGLSARLAKSDRLGVKVVGPLSEMNWPISEETVNGWFTKILLGWFNFLNAKGALPSHSIASKPIAVQ